MKYNEVAKMIVKKRCYLLPPGTSMEEISKNLKIPYRKLNEWKEGKGFPPAFVEAKINAYVNAKNTPWQRNFRKK